jgi:hypothetical protein
MENVLTMSKSKLPPPPGDILKERLAAVLEGGREGTKLPSGFTLRVKPDRRRVQLPIPAGLDRRRRST